MESGADVGSSRCIEIGQRDRHDLLGREHRATRVADRLQFARQILLEEGDVKALVLQEIQGAHHLASSLVGVDGVGAWRAEGVLLCRKQALSLERKPRHLPSASRENVRLVNLLPKDLLRAPDVLRDALDVFLAEPIYGHLPGELRLLGIGREPLLRGGV